MLSRTSALILLVAGAGCGLGTDGPFKRALLLPTEPTHANIQEYKTLTPPSEEPQEPATPTLVAQVSPIAKEVSPPTPPEPAVEAKPADPLEELYRKAVARYATFDSYIARLKRKEQVNGRDEPEELLLVKFRKKPWSVYFKWLGTEHKGREATYVKDHYDDKLHTYLAAGDMPLVPAGKIFSLAPDSSLIRGRCRHIVTEAGVGNLIEQLGKLLAAKDKNGNRAVRYLGPQKRPEYEAPLEAIEQTIAPKTESMLDGGGRRFIYFDPSNDLPVLVITQDKTGHQVEYYCWDRFQYPVKLDDKDFDPEQMGKTP